jgi:hypothetical protein
VIWAGAQHPSDGRFIEDGQVSGLRLTRNFDMVSIPSTSASSRPDLRARGFFPPAKGGRWRRSPESTRWRRGNALSIEEGKYDGFHPIFPTMGEKENVLEYHVMKAYF